MHDTSKSGCGAAHTLYNFVTPESASQCCVAVPSSAVAVRRSCASRMNLVTIAWFGKIIEHCVDRRGLKHYSNIAIRLSFLPSLALLLFMALDNLRQNSGTYWMCKSLMLQPLQGGHAAPRSTAPRAAAHSSPVPHPWESGVWVLLQYTGIFLFTLFTDIISC